MKNLFKSLTLAVVAVAALATVASAANGVIGLYFEEDANVSRHYAQPDEIFKVYVMVSGLNESLDAAEYKLNLPASVTVLSRDFNSDRAVVLGSEQDGTAVGIGECTPVFDDTSYSYYLIETLTCMAVGTFAVADLTLTKFEGAGNDTDPTVTGPRYSNCIGDAVLFAQIDNAQLSSSVNTESQSWGGVKALFGE